MPVPQIEIVLHHDGVELARVTLPPGEYVIGRSAQAQIRAETPLLSRQHARLTIATEHLLLEDLGSSNGSFINEQAITEATHVLPDQRIRLGDVTLEIKRPRGLAGQHVPPDQGRATIRRFLPDELLGEKRYAVGKIVARGGMGAIVDARQNATHRTVAMKVMLETGNEADVLRFIEEAQITAQLDHPNIVPIYELGVDAQDQLFYTMKMVRGITLKKVIQLLAAGTEATVKKYPLPTLLTIFQKVCDPVAFAHAKGVIHRDLKPENIMLGDFGSVLVMDWGLAKVVGNQRSGVNVQSVARSVVMSTRAAQPHLSGTMLGSIMGTPQYMSPEQARGEVDQLDARSDIYALGTILFEILHLRPVVTGGGAMEIVNKVQHGEVEWTSPQSAIRDSKSAVPPGLLAVCRKALALDSNARYQRVEELQADLLAYQTGFATSAEKAGAWKQVKLLVKRNKIASLGIAAVLLVGSIFGTGAVFQLLRAERALTDLRGTAPTFHAQALTLRNEGKFDEALEKIRFAVQLDPRNVDYHHFRADLLQSSGQLAPAAEEYRSVLALQPGHLAARTNLALCERWLLENGGADPLKREVQTQLVDALLAQNRRIEAAPLAARVGKGRGEFEAAIRARLKEYQNQPGWHEGRVGRVPSGDFWVDLGGFQVGDLSVLSGLPISELRLDGTERTSLSDLGDLPLTALRASNCKISDLSPLRGKKLVLLDLSANPVVDLSPVRGMPLRELHLSGSKVSDISPLKGIPIESLNLNSTEVRDLTPLAGMPLRSLSISSTRVRDLRPIQGSPLRRLEAFIDDLDISALAQCQELEEISIARRAVDVAALRDLPKLQRLGLGTDPFISRAQFHEEYINNERVRQVRALLPKLGRKIKFEAVRAFNNQGVRLDLKGYSEVKDLSPLCGLPIAFLDIPQTSVEDLGPLRGMPLVWLSFIDTKVTDVSPLLDCPTLESILVPRSARNVELLRKLPKLAYISFDKFDSIHFRPAQSAAEFWAEYDAERAVGKK